MLTLPRSNVVTQDDIHPVIENTALVVVVGESPTATVKISVPDYRSKKFRQLDRLTKASFKRQGDTWTFTGTSEHLSRVVGTQDATIKVMVTPEPGCEDCR